MPTSTNPTTTPEPRAPAATTLTTAQAAALAGYCLGAADYDVETYALAVGLGLDTGDHDALLAWIIAAAPVVAAAEAQTDAWVVANGKPNSEPLEDEDWVDATGDTEDAVRAMRAAGGGA